MERARRFWLDAEANDCFVSSLKEIVGIGGRNWISHGSFFCIALFWRFEPSGCERDLSNSSSITLPQSSLIWEYLTSIKFFWICRRKYPKSSAGGSECVSPVVGLQFSSM